MRHAAQIKLKVCQLKHITSLSHNNAQHSLTPIKTAANWCLIEEYILDKSQANRIRSKIKLFLGKVNGANENSVDELQSTDVDYTTTKSEINETRELFERCLAKANTSHSNESTHKCTAFQFYVDEMYKRHFFHHNYGADYDRPQKMRCIYPTLPMIEHSCDPNCAIV